MENLSIRGITKKFRIRKGGKEQEFLALGGVDMDIGAHEFVSVIGPSGSGKTTLLKIVAGLTKADSGEIRIGNRLITEPGEDRAVVFQTFGLFPWKTVLDNVKFPLIVRGKSDDEASKRARVFIEKVGLSKFEDAHPHQLSGGMQQRVGLARALTANPQILLMDEPFGAIDAQTREVMQTELLKLWSEEKKSVMFITHDLDEAVLLADRVVVLSSQPGVVQAVVDVPLPRPRWEYDARSHPEFAPVRHEIWEMLRQGIKIEATAEAA